MVSLRVCFSVVPITRSIYTISSYHTSALCWAGHNKWSKIKRPKEVADKERSNVITKLCSQIMSAVKVGGDDPNVNSHLASLLSRARSADIPKSTIERVMTSASVSLAKQTSVSSVDFVLFEARGPSGYSLLIETAPQKRVRTKSELQRILKQHGTTLGEPKTVLFQFDYKGVVKVTKDSISEECDTLELAIDIGAEDVQLVKDETDWEHIQFICEPKDLQSLTDAATKKGLNIVESVSSYIPNTSVTLSFQASQKASMLVSSLTDHIDVYRVYTNIKYE